MRVPGEHKLRARAGDERAHAGGAFNAKQALALADVFSREADVRWFEEPVSSDDLAGLAFVRARAPHLRCLRLQNSEGYWSGARRLAVCEGDYPGTTSSQAKSSYSDSSHSKSLLQR